GLVNANAVLNDPIGIRHDSSGEVAGIGEAVVVDDVLHEIGHVGNVSAGDATDVLRDFHEHSLGSKPLFTVLAIVHDTVRPKSLYEFLKLHDSPPYFTVMRYCSDFFWYF